MGVIWHEYEYRWMICLRGWTIDMESGEADAKKEGGLPKR